MPERQSPFVPTMRAATLGERASDTLRDVYESMAAQPLGQLLDLLGLSDLQGISESFTDPEAKYELKQGVTPRRVPRIPPASEARYKELLERFGGRGRFGSSEPPARMSGPGDRIAPNSQAGVGTPEQNMAKIPRFRSEYGTFIKHEGQWWRVPEQPAGSTSDVVLELLESGKPLPGTVPKVLQRKTISADELVSGIREAKGVREPQRRVNPKFDE